MLGVALLCTMSFFPMWRHLLTGRTIFFKPSFAGNPAVIAACETKVIAVAEVAAPKLPNIGRYNTGCGVGMDAFGSPIALHAMNPPFTTISGFAPKKAGFQSTRSASFPGSIEPISEAMPWVIAGLMVYLATYRFTR